MQEAIRASALILVLAVAAAALLAADKTSTATGNVSKLDAAQRTVVVTVAGGSEIRFVWTPETKITGTLAVGAKVTIRYTTLPDGQSLANQISVARS